MNSLQKEDINKIIDLFKQGIDFVLCGFVNKRIYLEEASEKANVKLINIDKSLELERLKLYVSSANISKKDRYFCVDEVMIDDSNVKTLCEFIGRKMPIIVLTSSKYKLKSYLSKWIRIDIYHPRAYKIQQWLKTEHNKEVSVAVIQKFNNIENLLDHLNFGSGVVEKKLPILQIIDGVIKTRNIKIRIKNVEYLQDNFNLKYVLKIILFNTSKFYSNYERLYAIRLLSICDANKNLYPLLDLPDVYYKWINRKITYPKELRIE